VLDRTRPRRAFRRLTGPLLEDVLAAGGASGDAVPDEPTSDETA